MIGQLAAVILVSTLSQTTDLLQQTSMTVLEPGEDFSLLCPVSDRVSGLFYWFRLKLGYMVETVAEGSFDNLKIREQFNNQRFTVTSRDNLYLIKISNVTKEDEATYFCQAGTAYEMKVINSTLLAVNDHENNQPSVYVRQSPETQSVQEGRSMSLQCSLLSKSKESPAQCPGEHSVYWFRAGPGESQPGVIYTHSNRSEGAEKRSCIYSLSRTVQSSSDYGTYYCAVVTCGHVLFGEGTSVKIKEQPWLFYVVLGTLLPYCVFVTAALMICRNRRTLCKQCKGKITASNRAEQDRLAPDPPSNEDSEEAALNYVALNFPSRKAHRGKTPRESPLDCTYSGIGEHL